MTAEDALGPRRPFIFDEDFLTELREDLPSSGIVIAKLGNTFVAEANIVNPSDGLHLLIAVAESVRGVALDPENVGGAGDLIASMVISAICTEIISKVGSILNEGDDFSSDVKTQ